MHLKSFTDCFLQARIGVSGARAFAELLKATSLGSRPCQTGGCSDVSPTPRLSISSPTFLSALAFFSPLIYIYIAFFLYAKT